MHILDQPCSDIEEQHEAHEESDNHERRGRNWRDTEVGRYLHDRTDICKLLIQRVNFLV